MLGAANSNSSLSNKVSVVAVDDFCILQWALHKYVAARYNINIRHLICPCCKLEIVQPSTDKFCQQATLELFFVQNNPALLVEVIISKENHNHN